MKFSSITNLHPVLFAIFPILSLFSFNIAEVTDDEFIEFSIIVIIMGLASFFVWIILSYILKNKEKAGFLTSFSLAMILLYGHVRSVFEDIFSQEPYFLILWLGIFVGGIFGISKIKRSIPNLTLIVFGISLSLIVFPLVDVVTYSQNISSFDDMYEDQIVSSQSLMSYKPDVYYIILDAYGSSDTLNKYYNFDNSEFLNFLDLHNFSVALKSNSNYPTTHQSLSSSLNLKYINFLAEIEDDKGEGALTYELIESCQVCKFLKSQGYKHIHFGSWWIGTKYIENADVNVNYFRDRASDFTMMYYDTTLISSIEHYLISVLGLTNDNLIQKNEFSLEQYERMLFKFEKLKEIPEMKEPTFVFAHFVSPHGPYVFDEDGNYLSPNEAKKIPDNEKYITQIRVINDKLEEVIDTILSKSTDPPIIIIQGDHGPPGELFKINPKIKGAKYWKTATIEESQTRYKILNAYYLPTDQDVLYPSISPVNSFRLIFNQYFGTDLEFLPDYNYAPHPKGSPFLNMTDKVHNSTFGNIDFEYDIAEKVDWKKYSIENPKQEKFSYLYDLLQIYYQREDLQLAFPTVKQGDFQNLFLWASKHGVITYPILSENEPIYELMLLYNKSQKLQSKFPEVTNELDLQGILCWAKNGGVNENTQLKLYSSFYEKKCSE